jgi:predicted DNA-binding transcriptional regulator AlpA
MWMGITNMESPFILNDELDVLTLTSESTRVRMEARGLFPRRVTIGQRKKARLRADVAEWLRDPDAWAQRHANGGAQ